MIIRHFVCWLAVAAAAGALAIHAKPLVTQPLHIIIQADVLNGQGLQRWQMPIKDIVGMAQDVLCEEMKHAVRRDAGECDLELGPVTVSALDADTERRIRGTGTQSGTIDDKGVKYLLEQGGSPGRERRVYIVQGLTYCGTPAPAHRSFAGCTHDASNNSILALLGIEEIATMDARRECALDLLHELGHQVDLYDRPQTDHLMHGDKVTRTGSLLDVGERKYFLRLTGDVPWLPKVVPVR